ncbi:MAG: hypothetical protein WD825_02270 [Gemmatimonadaceae bacterium]
MTLRILPLAALVAMAAAASAQGTKTPAPQTKQAPQARGLAVAAEAAPPRPPVILREVFSYTAGGRRDPFFSLLATPELRPTLTDLKLIGIAYDETGRRSVAMLRDIQTKTQYRVTTGMLLGRMRVALIKRKSVIFSIEEFGLNRQDSLVMGDTSKVRAR